MNLYAYDGSAAKFKEDTKTKIVILSETLLGYTYRTWRVKTASSVMILDYIMEHSSC